jgi:ElaB/YqjD/DUF883 family membrane-anchored ribosome-binding protein
MKRQEMNQAHQTQEELIGNLRAVIQNAQELMTQTVRYPTSEHSTGRAKLATALSIAYRELAHFEGALVGAKLIGTQAANDCLNESWEKRVLRVLRIKR